jgi:hypothetical protein
MAASTALRVLSLLTRYELSSQLMGAASVATTCHNCHDGSQHCIKGFVLAYEHSSQLMGAASVATSRQTAVHQGFCHCLQEFLAHGLDIELSYIWSWV